MLVPIVELAALQKDVVRNQFFAIGMKHCRQPLHQSLNIGTRLQGRFPWSWNRLGCRAARDHIRVGDETSAA